MVALETPLVQTGWNAKDFMLPATDGRVYRLTDLRGKNGLLVMFICNHCPYVQKQIGRIVDTAQALGEIGVVVVAINANDARQYPEDSFENMQQFAQQNALPFPYLYDESQLVARSYGAVCTPDYFGFNAALELQYRGRLDSSWSGIEENPARELLAAMTDIALDGSTARPQNPSIGCSIKWALSVQEPVAS